MSARTMSLLLVGLITGCALMAPKSRPIALDSVAARFKAKAGTERVAEARKIVSLMPVCPDEHYNKYWWLMFGFDESLYTDWARPSYFLARNDLIAALGPPDHERPYSPRDHWDYAMYRVGQNRKGETMGLYIHSFDGHVATSFVMPTNTPEMIQMQGHADGTVTVKTNYIQ